MRSPGTLCLPVPVCAKLKRGRLTRTLLAYIPLLALALPVRAAPPEQGQLDGNETLFTVMAAINAAGYDSDLANPANSPLRKAVRDYLGQKKLASVEDLKKFFAAHRQKDNGAELSQYVSFALCAGPPPDFKFRLKLPELPPDVAPLIGFNELLAEFYKEANIADIWAKSQGLYDKAIGEYQGPVVQGLTQVNAYLRNPTSGSVGRHFQIYLDLLSAPNQIHSRSYRDDYFIVLSPSPDPQADEVRHAYLHYLLDPVVMKYAEQLDKTRPLIDFAQGAPALEQSYKDDFFLLVTECLIKAIEARLTPGAAKKQAIVDQAAREGFILTPAFAELLPEYEKQDQAFRLNFKDMATAIDLKKESKRLDGIKFATERAFKKARVVEAVQPPELTGVFRLMADADALYEAKLYDQAREAYMKVLREPDQASIHAKAYYSLARIAARQNDGDLAEKLFQKTIEMNSDEATRAWCYVYLARLLDAQGERAQSVKHYQTALAIPGITKSAKDAAEKGLKEAFTKQK